MFVYLPSLSTIDGSNMARQIRKKNVINRTDSHDSKLMLTRGLSPMLLTTLVKRILNEERNIQEILKGMDCIC